MVRRHRFSPGDKVLDVVGNEWDRCRRHPCRRGARSRARVALPLRRRARERGCREVHGHVRRQSLRRRSTAALLVARPVQHGPLRTNAASGPAPSAVHANALGDLETRRSLARSRPAPRGRTVTLRIRGNPIRVSDASRSIATVGRASFGSASTASRACAARTSSSASIATFRAERRIRYAAVALDEWGASSLTFSRKVVVPGAGDPRARRCSRPQSRSRSVRGRRALRAGTPPCSSRPEIARSAPSSR